MSPKAKRQYITTLHDVSKKHRKLSLLRVSRQDTLDVILISYWPHNYNVCNCVCGLDFWV